MRLMLFWLLLVQISACKTRQGGADPSKVENTGNPVADVENLPYVSIRIMGIKGGICSGTLVEPTTVITASHCFFSLDTNGRRKATTSKVEVSHGSLYGKATYEVDSIRMNPTWLAATDDWQTSFAGDVAILTLKRPMMGIRSIKLSRTKPEIGDTIEFWGYGIDATNAPGTGGMILHHGSNTIRAFRSSYLRTESPVKLSEAGATQTQVLGGDSGGTVLNADGQLIGIITASGHEKNDPHWSSLANLVSDPVNLGFLESHLAADTWVKSDSSPSHESKSPGASPQDEYCRVGKVISEQSNGQEKLIYNVCTSGNSPSDIERAKTKAKVNVRESNPTRTRPLIFVEGSSSDCYSTVKACLD